MSCKSDLSEIEKISPGDTIWRITNTNVGPEFKNTAINKHEPANNIP
jgi:hypothetical protein